MGLKTDTQALHIKSSLLKGILYFLIFALVFPLVYLLIAFLLDAQLGNPWHSYDYLMMTTGITVGATGMYIIAYTTIELIKRGRGLPLSSSPPEKLVATGPYRWSRHPVYAGTIILVAGLFILLSSFWGLVLSLPMLIFFYLSYARGIEEPVLLDRYGNAYYQYREKVPFFVPYPFRNTIHNWITHLLDKLSAILNRPKIIRMGDHILFWGYGIWPGMGVTIGLGIMEFLLLSQGVSGTITAGLIITLTILCLAGVRFTWRIVTAIRKRLNFKNTSNQVGFISWGALLVLVLTLILFSTLTPYSFVLLLDAALPGLLMTHFLGRIGCMFYGCCYGKKAHSHNGLQYRHPALKVIRSEEIREKIVIPIQIFSSLYGLVGSLFICGLWYFSALPAGLPASISLFWYGSFRINEEWLRKQSVVWIDFISPAQVVSFMLILAGLAGLMAIGESQLLYRPLMEQQNLSELFENMHPILLLGSGVLTILLFSYHFKEIGQWK